MPGMIAVAGKDTSAWNRLHQQFRQVWDPLEVHSFREGHMAAHAHRGSPMFRDVRGRVMSVDGEASIYRPRPDLDLDTNNPFAHISDGFLQLGPECKGNLLVPDDANRHVYFASEWTATFPLYYLATKSSLLVSSHLRPLGRATGAETDMTGVLQFLRFAYNVVGRTVFKDIRRTLPGQSFRYDIEIGELHVWECSRFWTGLDFDRDPAEQAWGLLKTATQRCTAGTARLGVMLSGGWDSRTLLAAAQDTLPSDRLLGYSHGDTQSRELGLVRRLAGGRGVECHLEAIDNSAYELDALKTGFARVENIVFPHWHRAGFLLSSEGVQAATAGVYGEVLGGHYGPAMRLEGISKILAVGRGLVGTNQVSQRTSGESLAGDSAKLFSLASFSRPWTVKEEAWNSAPDPRSIINIDVDSAISRLISRGIQTLDQLIEAYITEQRGTQYINMQLLSCRAFVDVALPFVDQEMLLHASKIPLSTKIHNRLNQNILASHAPDLLKLPLAATLVAAKHPILLQEASRFVRRFNEEAQWKLHFASKGRVDYPRLGWVNFEFLRDGKSLSAIVDNLQSDIWDKNSLRNRIHAVIHGGIRESLHPLSDALMKAYTVDHMIQ